MLFIGLPPEALLEGSQIPSSRRCNGLLPQIRRQRRRVFRCSARRHDEPELSGSSGLLFPLIMRRLPLGAMASAIALQACAGQPPPPPVAPTHIDAQPRIVTADDVSTEAELVARGERALMEQNWPQAVDAYTTLLAADPSRPQVPEWTFDLGLAYEG